MKREVQEPQVPDRGWDSVPDVPPLRFAAALTGLAKSYQAKNTDLSRIKRRIAPEGFQRAMRQTGAVNARKALWWGDGAKPHILIMLRYLFLECSGLSVTASSF